MSVTKNILPQSPSGYQVWTSANCSDNDILGVYETLGQRSARSVAVTASGADVIVRFNVVREVYKEHGQDHNSWMPYSHKPSPLKVAEFEDDQVPNIVVAAGTTRTWQQVDLTVKDIKVVSGSTNVQIEVT